MSLLQRAGLPHALAIRGSLVADCRRDRCIDGAGAGSFHFIRTRRSTVGTGQIRPPLPNLRKPRLDEAFCIFGECIKQCYLLRVAQHTIML